MGCSWQLEGVGCTRRDFFALAVEARQALDVGDGEL